MLPVEQQSRAKEGSPSRGGNETTAVKCAHVVLIQNVSAREPGDRRKGKVTTAVAVPMVPLNRARRSSYDDLPALTPAGKKILPHRLLRN